jgi:hypothetical protein
MFIISNAEQRDAKFQAKDSHYVKRKFYVQYYIYKPSMVNSIMQLINPNAVFNRKYHSSTSEKFFFFSHQWYLLKTLVTKHDKKLRKSSVIMFMHIKMKQVHLMNIRRIIYLRINYHCIYHKITYLKMYTSVVSMFTFTLHLHKAQEPLRIQIH